MLWDLLIKKNQQTIDACCTFPENNFRVITSGPFLVRFVAAPSVCTSTRKCCFLPVGSAAPLPAVQPSHLCHTSPLGWWNHTANTEDDMLQIQRGEHGFFCKCQYGIWKKKWIPSFSVKMHTSHFQFWSLQSEAAHCRAVWWHGTVRWESSNNPLKLLAAVWYFKVTPEKRSVSK